MIVKLAAQVPGVVYQYRLYPDGRSAFPFASPGMNDIYEVTPEAVREDATPVFERLHPDDADRIVHDIQESAGPCGSSMRISRGAARQGAALAGFGMAMPERTADGGTLWHGIISDIPTATQAEEACVSARGTGSVHLYGFPRPQVSARLHIQTSLGYLEKDLPAGDAVRIETD